MQIDTHIAKSMQTNPTILFYNFYPFKIYLIDKNLLMYLQGLKKQFKFKI